MEDEAKEGHTLIVGNYDITLQLSQGRAIKIMGYIYAGESNEAINARLDAAQDALDRQFIRTDVVNKEAQIDAVTANMRQYREHVTLLVEKKNAVDRGDKAIKLNSQEKLQLGKLDADLANFNAQIESLQAAVKKGKSRLNGAAAS